MKKQIPRSRFSNTPFIDGFTGIDNDNTEILIGNSEKQEYLLNEPDDNPKYMTLFCSIIPKSEFPKINVSTSYATSIDDDAAKSTMTYGIYSGQPIRMKGFVSELAFQSRGLLSSDTSSIKNEWIDFLKLNPNVYTKVFHTQTHDIQIENAVDNAFDDSDVLHVKTRGHFFAGSYYPGIKLSDIQQYFFYMGTGLQAENYINIISARDIISTNNVLPAQDVTLQTLSTLEDDVCDGKIRITFPDGAQDGVTYTSISITKTTIVSDIAQIILKKEDISHE
ncbi:MAG: hypothetical protein LBJ92_02590 [Holosporales bacterium]|jgi:hypothetical protein|nr:hypothetical protein [Holosporales bacterium]